MGRSSSLVVLFMPRLTIWAAASISFFAFCSSTIRAGAPIINATGPKARRAFYVANVADPSQGEPAYELPGYSFTGTLTEQNTSAGRGWMTMEATIFFSWDVEYNTTDGSIVTSRLVDPVVLGTNGTLTSVRPAPVIKFLDATDNLKRTLAEATHIRHDGNFTSFSLEGAREAHPIRFDRLTRPKT